MRNAMICVSVMLAIFLGWPLAFGDGGAPKLEQSRAEARTVAPVKTGDALQTAAAVNVPAAPVQVAPESCYKRYQRTVKQCVGSNSAACRLAAADHWDMCEATGFWPE